MAVYNQIYSTSSNVLVTGSEGRDSIAVYGNHSTVQALGSSDIISVNGGRHDEGIWIGDEDNLVYAGDGNDSIKVESRGASIYGDAGNDTVNIRSDHVYADGGAGNDLLKIDAYSAYDDVTDVTVTGGDGKDTVEIRPDDSWGYSSEFNNLKVVVADFSSEDVLRLDGSDYYYGNKVLTQKVVNGSVVISDSSSIQSYTDDGDVVESNIFPSFSITLQGVSDIIEIADAKYYRYSYDTPKEYKTFGELFGVSAIDTTPAETVKPATDTVKSGVSTTTTVTTSETETTTESTETTTASTETSTTSITDITTESEDTVTSSATGTISESTTTTTTTATTETSTTTKTKTESKITAVDTTTNVVETTTNIVDTTTTSTPTTSTPTTTAASGGDTIINNYYGDYYDMSGNNGTIINQSSVTGAVTNNTSVDNSTTIIKYGDTYTYSGGDKVIDNYKQGEIVELASDYAGIDLKENSFFVKSSTGQLEIQNSRDKFVGYSANSEVVAYSYVAGSGGTVDGRGKSQAEILIGADNSNNQIYAGGSGSSLWGGVGGNDTLTGSSGYTEFFYAVGGGSDVVQSSNSTDLINLASVSLSQITEVSVEIGQVNINFVDGGNLKVNGESNVRYQVAEGTYSVNQYTKQWSAR